MKRKSRSYYRAAKVFGLRRQAKEGYGASTSLTPLVVVCPLDLGLFNLDYLLSVFTLLSKL